MVWVKVRVVMVVVVAKVKVREVSDECSHRKNRDKGRETEMVYMLYLHHTQKEINARQHVAVSQSVTCCVGVNTRITLFYAAPASHILFLY